MCGKFLRAFVLQIMNKFAIIRSHKYLVTHGVSSFIDDFEIVLFMILHLRCQPCRFLKMEVTLSLLVFVMSSFGILILSPTNLR